MGGGGPAWPDTSRRPPACLGLPSVRVWARGIRCGRLPHPIPLVIPHSHSLHSYIFFHKGQAAAEASPRVFLSAWEVRSLEGSPRGGEVRLA